jgi:hypothetical protein
MRQCRVPLNPPVSNDGIRSGMKQPPAKLTCRRVGSGDRHHFFGYYNKTNWDRTGRYLLGHEVPVKTARLTPELTAAVGYFDLADDGAFHFVAQTRAWNWQMGSQLQWLDGKPGRHIIYNIRTDDPGSLFPNFASEICDLDTGKKRQLPAPIYVVAPNSQFALCVNYRRLYVTHETIGYPENGQHTALANDPDDDGIYRMDVETGRLELIVSYRDLRNFNPKPSMEKAIHWVSHIEINPSSTRVLFLHRWTERVKDETCFLHRLITMNPDGSGMRLLECSDHPLPQLQQDFDPSTVGTFDYEKSEYQISHPLWRDDRSIIVWGPHQGKIHYHLYDDMEPAEVQVVGDGVLTENGHMTFSPVNHDWLLSDTYPDPVTNERILFLYDMRSGEQYDLGSFRDDPLLSKENRCDLHPRWRRDGNQVCIDSVHEGGRQMYILDISALTKAD